VLDQVSTPIFRQGFSSLHAITALSPSDVWGVRIGTVKNKCCPTGLIERWDGMEMIV
jgi:hypothetical protein